MEVVSIHFFHLHSSPWTWVRRVWNECGNRKTHPIGFTGRPPSPHSMPRFNSLPMRLMVLNLVSSVQWLFTCLAQLMKHAPSMNQYWEIVTHAGAYWEIIHSCRGTIAPAQVSVMHPLMGSPSSGSLTSLFSQPMYDLVFKSKNSSVIPDNSLKLERMQT